MECMELMERGRVYDVIERTCQGEWEEPLISVTDFEAKIVEFSSVERWIMTVG